MRLADLESLVAFGHRENPTHVIHHVVVGQDRDVLCPGECRAFSEIERRTAPCKGNSFVVTV